MIRWLLLLLISLVGVFGPSLSPGIFSEDRVDAVAEQIRETVGFQSDHAALVELKNSELRWPIDRGTLAKIASAALADGALAVGIDIDMSTPTNGDAQLLELAQRDKRVVALRLPNALESRGTDSEGFVFDTSAKFLGISCNEANAAMSAESQPFAIRIALVAGLIRDALYQNCTGSLLRPYIRSGAAGPPVVAVSDVLQMKGTLRGRVAILGTQDTLAGAVTYNGIRSSAEINANAVESALEASWRRPNATTSALVYAVLMLALYLAIRHGRSRGILIAHAAGLALAAVLVRIWLWYPLLPALTLLFVASAWDPVRKVKSATRVGV
jgi:hypothetical protein